MLFCYYNTMNLKKQHLYSMSETAHNVNYAGRMMPQAILVPEAPEGWV